MADSPPPSSAGKVNGQIEIRDVRHITEVLERLEYQPHSLSLKFNDVSDISYPTHIERMDAGENLLYLSLCDAPGLEDASLASCLLTLIAETDSTLVSFGELRVQRATHLAQGLTLEVSLPTVLHTGSKRKDARISLTSAMKVQARIVCFTDQEPLIATLGNISHGGCMLDMPLSRCGSLKGNMDLPSVSLHFPNGEQFKTQASIRYIKPAARSHHASIGLAFTGLDQQGIQQLSHVINETDREVAWRKGEGMQLAGPSTLYAEDRTQRRRHQSRAISVSAPMVEDLKGIVRTQHLFLLALQQQAPLPNKQLAESADTLMQLLQHNRQQLFYALGCLSDEPAWVQHSLAVACRLCDLMLVEPEHAPRAREATIAALVHDMGKAMLVSAELPSLEGTLESGQLERLRQHVPVLIEALEHGGLVTSEMQAEIISGINERLDGTGYPQGLDRHGMTPLSRMASVIDTIDAMTRPRGDRRASTAMEAYQLLYRQPERFDRHWVVRYIQRHGFYPIASLIRFSQGYLAWVIHLDESGQPSRIRVVKNTSQDGAVLNEVLNRVDFAQLGRLEGLVCPDAYGLAPY
ncbi:HD domain-containing phosphohydrolase [Larsenimonas rhizosphaerae]|uniref:HD domain-containing phosphohydrolase n=1 Tax=Larsenimonas rhizosphaerae TaxID=2944682 RepID=UPI002033B112|nr:HD domain-containing phosphohydrolase [Larsenimonas rhizosphaerae]MCM2130497.1 PilZ domain-containing protein [Larsenimonas rhizosphaerae]